MYSHITNGEIDPKFAKRYESEEKELNGLLERKDWSNAIAFMKWAENKNRYISIYYNAKEKRKVKELVENWGIDEEIFTQYITPRK
jgi:hypothetical protein